MSVARAAQHCFTRAHCRVYRATGGALGAHVHGAPVLLMRTTGRRSGIRRETPLLYFENDDGVVVVASNGGAPRHPWWFVNLTADPSVEIQVRGEVRRMRARATSGDERASLWELVTSHYPGYESYQERTTREI